MRLPLAELTDPNLGFDEQQKAVDEAKAIAMIHHAIAKGITYFDSAYFYHGGHSERVLGKAIQKYRHQVRIATKSPVRFMNDAKDFNRILDEQLCRLEIDYLDFYLLHGLSRETWTKGKELGVLDFLDTILSDGRAKHVGFSFHDSVDVFKEIIDAYDWTMCQIQYNYFDQDFQAGTEGLRYAAEQGIGVVIMEPLRGGRLTDKIPPEVQRIWDSAPPQRSPADWGLRWVLDHPEVSMVLSGMSTMDQLEENLRIVEDAFPNSLSSTELDTVERVAATYRQLLKVPCTNCGYCMPCPNGVQIPMNFSFYNDACMFDDAPLNKHLYTMMMRPEQRAGNCQACGACEEKCPQQIRIADTLIEVNARLG
jgi:predicted aldo/keto reductase-like oxidoreductase